MNSQIAIAIITHNACHHLPHCLPPFLNSPLKPRVLVVNSSSNDGTVELAQEMGAETLVIPRLKFNHGTTREKARQYLNADVLVMATPDAYIKDKDALTKLVEPILNEDASVAYGRQIPHENADFFESFPRDFNYGQKSHIRSLKEIEIYGSYMFFCSNAFAAYSNKALESIGGFSPVLIGEDTVAVAKLLHAKHKVAYVAEAIVKHSHRYSLKDEFCRSFDTGLARKAFHELISLGGKDTIRGKQYVSALAKKLLKEGPHLIPYAVLQSGLKWLGYKLGQTSIHAPTCIKRFFSAQDFYWSSEEAFK